VSIVFAGLIVAYSPMIQAVYSGKKEDKVIEKKIDDKVINEDIEESATELEVAG